MRTSHSDDHDRERDLDKAAEQEPEAFRARPRAFFFPKRPPAPIVVPVEKLWRPSDGAL